MRPPGWEPVTAADRGRAAKNGRYELNWIAFETTDSPGSGWLAAATGTYRLFSGFASVLCHRENSRVRRG
jgi:hypothetical protein